MLSELRGSFGEGLPAWFAAPREERETVLCVARREIEAWFLADEDAVCEVTGGDYRAPSETGESATKRRLQDLFGSARNSLLPLNDIELAKRFGGKFNPSRARRHSASFNYFWSLVEAKVAAIS